jgi:hypothetical protein
MKKLTTLMLTAALAMSMAVPAFAAEAPTVPTPNMDATALNEDGESITTVPITVTAEATTFKVTLPTALPTTLDPDTGETTTADNAYITNQSYGSIVVTDITATDNSTNTSAATWHLAKYGEDMSQVTVDANLLGLQIAPLSGKTGATQGTALATVAGSPASQTLLTAPNKEWVIKGKDAADGSSTLRIVYDTTVSAVSNKVENSNIANVVITIAWDSATADYNQ